MKGLSMEGMSIDEIIEYARVFEENSIKYYKDAAEQVNTQSSQDFLLSLADEERRHLEALEKLKKVIDEGQKIPLPKNKVKNLGYADYFTEGILEENARYQDIVMTAMVKEKKAVDTYEKFSRYVDDEQAQKLFDYLANEERKHLRKFEEEYDNLLSED
jgi:rubrerythrin